MAPDPPRRRIVGVAGCPGSGKSTIAARLAAEHPDTCVVVPMDGFHLDDEQLRRLDRADRKGAPDTFDVDGYVDLLRRVRDHADRTVYAPRFDRGRELSVAGAIAVRPEHTTVITEGNYLLHDRDGWERVHSLLDECWFVDGDDAVRVARLIERHVGHGRSERAARAWVRDVDEPNARLVRSTMARADRVVSFETGPPDGALEA